jgi:hypothetical protein
VRAGRQRSDELWRPLYKQNRTLAAVSPPKKGITLAFSRGADFEGKYGLLEGVGKVSKNVRMKDPKAVTKSPPLLHETGT